MMFMPQPHSHYGVPCTVQRCNPHNHPIGGALLNRQWTEKEDDILRDYRERRPHWVTEVSDLLGIARQEVRRRWMQLEREAQRGTPDRRHWTREDDLLLIKAARKGKKGGFRDVVKELDRTPSAVTVRLTRLRKLGKLS